MLDALFAFRPVTHLFLPLGLVRLQLFDIFLSSKKLFRSEVDLFSSAGSCRCGPLRQEFGAAGRAWQLCVLPSRPALALLQKASRKLSQESVSSLRELLLPDQSVFS